MMTPIHTLRKFLQYTLATSLLVIAAASSAVTQVVQMPPVARLLADPANGAGYSRPRIVGSSSAMNNEASVLGSPSLVEANEVERTAFDKTNEARLSNGLSALVWDAELCRMARAHSEDMARSGYFAHETPDGLQLKDRAHARGIGHFKVIGENIAYNKGYADPGAFAVERWMNSGGHRANMLYAAFQASAIGSYVSIDGSVYLTQVFITR